MKKIILLILFASVAISSNAKGKQSGGKQFMIGLGGGLNSTWLLNGNGMDQGELWDYKSSLGGQAGINAVFQLNDNIGIGSGVFFSMHNQKFKGSIGGSEVYNVNANLTYIDVPLLLRLGGVENGFYFEVGPQLGFLSSAKEDYISVPTAKNGDYSGRDVKSFFNGFDFGSVLGFGGQFDASDNLAISIGLRLNYSFTDATKEYTEDQLEAQVDANNYSWTDLWAHFDSKQQYTTYTPTHRASGGLFLSVMYKM